MLALSLYRAGRCPGCSGNLEVTTDPANEWAFHEDLPTQCHRCAAFSRSADAYAEHPHPRALLHAVPLTPRR